MIPTSEDIIQFVTDSIPSFEASGNVEKLSGGNLNFVWRVFGNPSPVIVKHAPPFIAAAPDIPINPDRIIFEATALRLLNNEYLPFPGGHIHPPTPIHIDSEKHILIMEDIGNVPTLDVAVQIDNKLGAQLGLYLANLHSKSNRNEIGKQELNNISIQQTRLDVQYSQIASLLADVGIVDAEELGKKAQELGEKYLNPGRCLIMGDLWPRSILVQNSPPLLYLIDWEFAHYGRPSQDIGHLMAHLHMLGHRAQDTITKAGFQSFASSFIQSYYTHIHSEAPSLFDAAEIHDAGVHFGAEIIARTLGNFQSGYVYEGLGPTDSVMQEAIETATRYLREPLLFKDFFIASV